MYSEVYSAVAYIAVLHGVYKKATASARSRTRSTPEESLAQPTMLLALTMHLSASRACV